MFSKLQLGVLLVFQLQYGVQSEQRTPRFYLHPEDTEDNIELHRYIRAIEYKGKIDILYEKMISLGEQITFTYEYTYNFDTGEEPFIHTEADSIASISTPVVFEIRHFESESWSLPVVIGIYPPFHYLNKTLCTPLEVARSEPQRILQVVISTRSEEKVSFSLRVTLRNTRVTSGNMADVLLSPTSPIYFKVGPFQNFTTPYLRLDVSLKPEEGIREVCLTVALQPSVCPVQDLESNVQFNAISHTISTVTTIMLKPEDFTEEKFLVFVMHEDYSRCDSFGNKWKDQDLPITRENYSEYELANHQLMFSLRESVPTTTYVFATVGVLSILIVTCVVIAALYIRSSRGVSFYNEILKDPQTASPYNLCFFFFYVKDSSSRADVSLQASSTQTQDQISKSAQRYCGTMLVVSIFYTIPVVQFVGLYQRIFQQSGNEDQCYFNFKCLHPINGITAFNHVFSNVGYIVLGILFLFLVRFDHYRYDRRNDRQKMRGIFPHYGIFYAMGSALVMEGFMSAFYHVCPTRLNFQFDTSFMYIIATLCMVKIYQSRHPDTNISAITTFVGIGVVVFLVVITTVTQAWGMWMTVTILHMITSLIMSVHLYSWGDWKLCSCREDGINFPMGSTFQEQVNLFFKSFLFSFRLPMEPMTIALLVLNGLNWTVTVLGYVKFYPIQDIASYLLMIFLLNLGIYKGIYIIFKLFVARESISWKSWMYAGIAIPFWAAGLVMFFKVTATWNLSQAESREQNDECVVLGFYDYHDIWHFLSAFGLFFTYLFLFTVDDELKNLDRDIIKVF